MLAEAAAEMTREAVETALQTRRMDVAAGRAKAARIDRLAAMGKDGLDEAEQLRAYNVGTERQVEGGSRSVETSRSPNSVMPRHPHGT